MSTKDTQARLLGGPSGESASIETSGRMIRPALQLPSVLVDKSKIHFGQDGVRLEAVDPSNVGMVDLTIHPEAFESYAVDADDELLTGVDLSDLESKLSNARLGKKTDDPVSLEIDSARTVIEIEREYVENTVTYADELMNIDPDSIREEPNLPGLDLSGSATVEVSAFKDAVEHIDESGNHIAFRERGGDLVFTQKGHEDSPSEYGSAVSIDGVADVPDDKSPVSTFSLDYLIDMARALKKAKVDEVSIRWGQEFPLMMDAERTTEDAVAYEVTFILAPRISSGDSR